jgi:hypothetical protein
VNDISGERPSIAHAVQADPLDRRSSEHFTLTRDFQVAEFVEYRHDVFSNGLCLPKTPKAAKSLGF